MMTNPNMLAGAACVGLLLAAISCIGGSSIPPTPVPTAVELTAKVEIEETESTATPVATLTAIPDATRIPDATPTAVMVPTPQATQVPEATAVAAPNPTPEAAPTSLPYESESAMYDIYPGFTISMSEALATLEQIEENNDTSMIPVLIEIMRFMPTRSSRDSVASTLSVLTGQPFSGDDWDKWMDWMGTNLDGIAPPEGYPDWKAELYSAIDQRFAYFLRPARDFSRIRLEEIVWGGVRPDGIPDLRRPSFLEASEAGYMRADDRVFGLEINGDIRAYPLRVVNAHEMVNDSVGGEPISLMW